jgi:hypothetical protein
MRRAIAKHDARQGWLDLPKFEHIPEMLEMRGGVFKRTLEMPLDEYRDCLAVLEERLDSYKPARRSVVKEKEDRRVVREMRGLVRELAPYFAKDVGMTVGRAVELRKAGLESGLSIHAGIAARARWHSTKNQ